MPYSAEISRTAPTAFLFLLDQSASMQDAFGGAEQRGDAAPSKARVLADVVNRLLQNLILRCAKEDGVRDYFHVGVIGYGDRVQPLVQPGEGEETPGDLIPISHLADRPLRLEERLKKTRGPEGEEVEQRAKVPVWFDPHAKNGTPMCQALDLAAAMLRRWIDAHPHAFPPVVLNVTDGEATDGDPLRYAQQLRSLCHRRRRNPAFQRSPLRVRGSRCDAARGTRRTARQRVRAAAFPDVEPFAVLDAGGGRAGRLPRQPGYARLRLQR